MKSKTTRRALVLSLLSLLLCCSMLVGTTFAWFTDSVTSGNNRIVAGNLDIELYYQVEGKTDWTKVTETSNIFMENALWEPGHTEVVKLKVVNEGTLALKYQLGVNVAEETGSINKDGNPFKLSDYIKFAVVDGATNYTREQAVAAAEAAEATALNVSYSSETLSLDAKNDGDTDEKTVTLVVYMPTSVGNEANYKTDANRPEILLGLSLFATQQTAESDSFNNQYDKDSWANGIQVNNANELKAALAAGGSIVLGADIALDAAAEIPAGATVTLNMNGKKLSTNGTNAIYTSGDLTIIGEGTISSVSNYAIRVQKGKLTIDSNDVNVVSEFGAISVFNGADVTINGGYFENKGYNDRTSHTIYLGGYGTININGGTFKSGYSNGGIDTICGYGWSNNANQKAVINLNGGTFYPSGLNGAYYFISNYDGAWTEININGGTYHKYDPSKIGGTKFAANRVAINNGDGTWTVDRDYEVVTPAAGATAQQNGAALADAINTADTPYIQLGAGEYKMPSVDTTKEITIVGTKDTVIDNTMGAYMDSAKVAFEGVTIKGSTGMVNGNGSDYAALYAPNVTYINCTFDGAFRIGRDGATFIGCTFTNLGNDYVWTYGNDCTFENCTFNTDGKAILIYSDGGNEVAKVTVKNCTFNATAGAKAGAIANQNCAAIEIHNYGNGVELTTGGNTYGENFSGEWRIKTYETGRTKVFVNGVEYTTIAIDGKTMTIDGNRNVTVND